MNVVVVTNGAANNAADAPIQEVVEQHIDVDFAVGVENEIVRIFYCEHVLLNKNDVDCAQEVGFVGVQCGNGVDNGRSVGRCVGAVLFVPRQVIGNDEFNVHVFSCSQVSPFIGAIGRKVAEKRRNVSIDLTTNSIVRVRVPHATVVGFVTRRWNGHLNFMRGANLHLLQCEVGVTPTLLLPRVPLALKSLRHNW